MRISDWSSDVCSSDLIWAARRDTVRRAAQAVLEAAEAIQATGASRRLLEVRGSFDEFNLDIELLHDGPPLKLQSGPGKSARSEEHTSELQSLMRISYAVFCLKKKKTHQSHTLQQEYTTTNRTTYINS